MRLTCPCRDTNLQSRLEDSMPLNLLMSLENCIA